MRHEPGSPQELDESLGFFSRDVRAELWIAQGATQLSEQALRDDELELPIQPASEQRGRDAGGCQDRGNQDVGVEDGSQSLPTARPRSVLSFDGEPHGVILAHTVLIPELLEEIVPDATSRSAILTSLGIRPPTSE